MTYPNITLKIESHIPSVIYNADENTSREMIKEGKSLEIIIKDLAKNLDLVETELADILILCEHGVERLIDDLPKLNKYSTEFELEDAIEKQKEDLKNKREMYSDNAEITDVVRAELVRNQNIDILSSLVELVFNILIAKTVMVSSDLGIGNIILDDENKYIRLHSKMSSELTKMETSLKIVS